MYAGEYIVYARYGRAQIRPLPWFFRAVKSQEILTSLPRFDLISLTSHENSNHGWENY